ncbi:response regulator receiver protein [Candidatus Magnetoovum chiemensis]|nr:response regulator receiver protein [Candidatus Magnetoovum chiemensis]
MSGINLLIIDDEEDFMSALSERLELRRYKVRTVNSAEAAFGEVKRQVPEVVLLDLKMPGMHGIEVLKILKQLDTSIEIIILTGQGLNKHKEEALKHGAFDFLLKPVDIDTLIERIEQANKKRIIEKQYLNSKRI